MRNKAKTKINRIIDAVDKLPCFSLDDLAAVESNKDYLKNILSRYEKMGKVIRLKKGLFVTRRYLEGKGAGIARETFLEFLANFLYSSSYLSLEYILDKHSLITDAPFSLTSVAKNKTARFSNKLGSFSYRKIKNDLFVGFNVVSKGGFDILEATKAKALFDFLYLRKNNLPVKEAVEELRLNLEHLTKSDIKEFKKYIKLEESKKMEKISDFIFELL